MPVNYIFSHNQLKVLLLGCGFSKIVGLNLDDSELDAETALEALNQLSNSGIISSDGNRFIGSKEAKLIAELLGMSDNYIAVHTSKETLPDLCCYTANKILICGSEPGYEKRIAIRLSNFDDFFSDLYDEGYFPEDSEHMVIDEEELKAFEKSLFENYDPNSPVNPDLHILFSAEEVDKNGSNQRFVRVIEYYFYNYILFFSKGKTERQICTLEALNAFLKRMMIKNDNNRNLCSVC